MPPNLRRYADALKRRRYFLAGLGPLVLWLVTTRKGFSLSLTLIAAFAVMGAGLLDGAAGLTGDRHAPDGQVASLRDDPGAPVLSPGDRLTALLSLTPAQELATSAVAGAEPQTEVAPGVRGVDISVACTTNPTARNVPNPSVGALIAVHSSEEQAGAAGPSAVCRYHATDLGWGGAGYHLYIRSDGAVYRLLPDRIQPWAQKRWNRGVAIVLQGRSGTAGFPSEQQLSALYRLVPALAAQYGVTPEHVYAHRDFTAMDQALVRAGRWTGDTAEANDHTDTGGSWDANQWGLRDRVRAVQQPSSVPRPDLTPGAAVTGTASYYNPTGNRTAAGDAYDGKALTAATWVVDGRPAYPFGSWLKVCEGERCEVARVNDTGAFVPPRVVDLSPRVFVNVATGRRWVMCDANGRPAGACWRTDDPAYRTALARGVLNATVTYLGRDGTDEFGQPVAFYPCAGSPALGGFVYGDSLREYRRLTSTRVGCPVDPEPTSPDGVEWRQRMTLGVLRWTPQRGAWFEPR